MIGRFDLCRCPNRFSEVDERKRKPVTFLEVQAGRQAAASYGRVTAYAELTR